MTAKPRFTLIAGRPVEIPERETPVQAARRRYGKEFGRVIWQNGEGPTFYTLDRLHALAADKEARRRRRGK